MFTIFKKRKGVGTIEVCVVVISVAMVLSLVMRVMPIFIEKKQLDTFATEIVRSAEIEGKVGSETNRRIDEMEEETGLTPSIRWSTSGNIQLNNKFYVEITYTTNIGLFGNFGSFPITLKSKATGVSEVYWK